VITVYAKVENGEVVAIGLPIIGELSDHRTVSNYNQLGIEVLLREGWLPIVGEKPAYDTTTQMLNVAYTVESTQVIATYTVVAKPPEPTTTEERVLLLQNAVDFLLMSI